MATRDSYRNHAGKVLISVTGVIGRFKESGGLLYWANQQGLAGLTLEQARKPAADAGTFAHDLVEAHIHEQPAPIISGDENTVAKAKRAFDAYLSWTKMVNLELLYTEVPLVSERYQFGGRLDGVGKVVAMNNGLALVDWKTSNKVYGDYLLQGAAYIILWNENYPDNPITGGFHLCRFSKEEGDFAHHYYPSLDDEQETFLLMRQLYDKVKKVEKRV